MCCFVRLRSLSAYCYVMKSIPLITESPVRPMLTNMHVLSMHSFSRDFALLLLAKKQAELNI